MGKGLRFLWVGIGRLRLVGIRRGLRWCRRVLVRLLECVVDGMGMMGERWGGR